jgi:hypothetical protein
MTPAGPFRLSYSQQIADRLELLSDLAAANRRLQQYVDVVNTMRRWLCDAPVEWGDPIFRYQHLGLDVYHRAFEMIAVTYAVDPVRRIVYIQDIQPMTDRGLDLFP